MICNKCGATNAEDAKFCSKCGSPLTKQIKKANISNKDTNSNSNTNVDLTKTVKSLPKKAIIGIILAIVAGAIIVVISSAKPTINLNDYIVIETSGYDGYGECNISVDWDKIQNKYGSKVKYTSKAKQNFGFLLDYQDAINVVINDSSVNLDANNYLHNGDTVKYTWNVDEEDINNYVKCNVKYRDGSYTVSGLEQAKTIDLLGFLSEPYATFSGRVGKAKVELNVNLEDKTELYRDDNLIIVYNKSTWPSGINVIKNNENLCSLYYGYISDKDEKELVNGDTISLVVSGAEQLLDYGYSVEPSMIPVTVNGVSEFYSSSEDVNVDGIKLYLEQYFNSTESNLYNSTIKGVYFCTPKDTTITSYKNLVIVDFDLYEKDLSGGFGFREGTEEHVFVFNDCYSNEDKFCFEDRKSVDINSKWTYINFDAYLDKVKLDYIATSVD